jgi:ATP phosphoribosyltransferase regulatory subunit HisZ
MVYEHEIPTGSKLYFSHTAALKRRIEHTASEILITKGFEEIVTPLFSYHQHLSIEDDKEVIRVHDECNNPMTLRADSTIDVVRIIDKRLGRNTTHKKWFYVQPVFRFPAQERYQVGAEIIDEVRLETVLDAAIDIFEALECTPLLQLSNINIPKILVKEFGFDMEHFKRIEVGVLQNSTHAWIHKLIYVRHADDIDEVLLSEVPSSIKVELEKLKKLAQNIAYKQVVIAPLYYAKMRYYDELFFRFVHNNDVLSRGGRYEDSNMQSVGFALNVDEIIETICSKENKGQEQ